MQWSIPAKADEGLRPAETSQRDKFHLHVYEERHAEQQRRDVQQEQVSGERIVNDTNSETAKKILNEHSQASFRGEKQYLQGQRLLRRSLLY